MAQRKVVDIQIDKIKNIFDVRKVLDDDNILRLAELIQAGVDLPPIEVIELPDGGYAYIDGRHRAAARSIHNIPTVPAIVRPVSDGTSKHTLELYAQALKANYGGPKPPTKPDLEHVVNQMLEIGATESEIKKHLSFIPPVVLKKYVSFGQTNIVRRNIRQAMAWIEAGRSLEAAAKMYKIRPEVLRNAIEGKKSKMDGSPALEFKNYVTFALRQANMGIAKRLELLMDRVELGVITPEHAEQVLDAWEKSLNGSAHRLRDWRERLKQRDTNSTGAKDNSDE